MDIYRKYRQLVVDYLENGCASEAGFPAKAGYTVKSLAAGEYNLNYLVENKKQSVVFRVNIGTQIDRDDQIEYEYRTLHLLAASDVTPKPLWVDNSHKHIDRGISIMEYLPGRHLDYTKDLAGAARVFAIIHQLEIAPSDNHLIEEDKPLTLIYEECNRLLATYFHSDLADTEIKNYLRELLDWADAARKSETYFTEDPYLCIVNTEVNSGNFIVNDDKNTIHLIDWEMPRWGDPSSDLCHFCSPLTTLWKTTHRLSHEQSNFFLDEYSSHLKSKYLRETLTDRLRLKAPFVYLRGISWSAMGWVAYQTDFQGIRNEDTWRKLCEYLDLAFIRALFDPFICKRP